MRGVWVWAAFAIACGPSLVDHVARMWQLEQYHYLPALFLAVALLVWQRWDRVCHTPSGWGAWWFLTAGAVLLVLGYLSGSSWLGAVSFVSFLAAWMSTHRTIDGSSLFHLWPPALMLIPLPLGFDASLTHWMQLWSSRVSSYALDFLEVPHALFGNVLRLSSGTLFVEEACSGVQSLYTVVFVGILVVSIFRRSIWLLPFYLGAAIFWAGAMNVARILAIAYSQHHFNFDLAHGWPHAMLGYVCLAGACLLLLSTDRLLRVLAFPIESNSRTGFEQNPVVHGWNRSFAQSDSRVLTVSSSFSPMSPWVARGLMAFCVIAFAAHLLRFTPRASAEVERGVQTRLPQVPANLGPLIPGFIQYAHETVEGNINQPMGEYADVWKGEYQGIPVTPALSQPYPEWHDLCVCYTGAGLNLNDRQVVKAEDEWNYVAARFISSEGAVSYLWFSAFDFLKNPVNAPDSGVLTRWLSRLNSSDSLLKGSAVSSELAIVQLKVDLDGFLPQDSVDALTELHTLARQALGSPSIN